MPPIKPMTEEEIATEKKHIVETRLGILAGDQQPTGAQMALAIEESNKWEKRYRARFENTNSPAG